MMIALKDDRPNRKDSVGLRPDSRTAAHTLPTSLPSDLAEVVESWDSLPPEVRAEVLGLVRSSLPTQRPHTNDESNEIDEHCE
jgi:hypothetical protein